MGAQFAGGIRNLNSDYIVANDLAKATGGQAFQGNNGLASALLDATEDGGNYYSLTYAPSNLNYDGSLRKIQVKLAKSGYHLSYRQSYFADDPNAPVSDSEKKKKNQSDEDTPEQAVLKAQERPLYACLQQGAPLLHQVIFKVRIHAEGAPTLATPEQMLKLAQQPAYTQGKRQPSSKVPKPVQIQKYAIYYVVASRQLKRTNDSSIPLEFAAVAYNADGWVVNSIFEKAAPEGEPNPWAESQPEVPESWEPVRRDVYRALQELDVPAGATSIRVAVRDSATDRVGAMEIPLPLAPEPESGKVVPSAQTPAQPSAPVNAN